MIKRSQFGPVRKASHYHGDERFQLGERRRLPAPTVVMVDSVKGRGGHRVCNAVPVVRVGPVSPAACTRSVRTASGMTWWGDGTLVLEIADQ